MLKRLKLLMCVKKLNTFSSVGKEPFLLHCQGGYRSMIAASILKARGIHNFKEVDGGYKAITATEVAKTSEKITQA